MTNIPLAIIGSGPAGLSAAIYTARAGIETLIIGSEPKIAGDYEIDNYFGFSETISGRELVMQGRRQAERFGATIIDNRVLGLHHADYGGFHIKTDKGDYHACGLVLATGVTRVRPGIDNLAFYDGKGVSYCVSCDGFFYRGRTVMVLGEGIYAANQALELLSYTPHVSICTQGAPVTMNDEYRNRLKAAGIPVIETRIRTLKGEGGLSSVVFDDGSEKATDGLFIAMGEASSLDFAYTLGVERNGVFLVADNEQKTNIEGVFAAGDCTGGFLQISVAVGEGAKAAKSAIAHVKKLCK
ncbi:NAD(P)/FAD-dependent oxidoreductase [Desulfovibrio mangrovi]|uniref:NAD(P)/FAD-dependent oxidoreductase n=1 Tax=Desulfovibrio mangrovi TaxID=2976983 RepID=UPI002247D9C7|nr:NAD(P)/FAD-dependent oxidoreductase [Desulfovibrio mangrovi]UZP68508.1 NAD(P)/FAD-dependent oxidoreductase [Desulfovibrio mangrovi]